MLPAMNNWCLLLYSRDRRRDSTLNSADEWAIAFCFSITKHSHFGLFLHPTPPHHNPSPSYPIPEPALQPTIQHQAKMPHYFTCLHELTGAVRDDVTCLLKTHMATEIDRPRRLTGYIPALANAIFALGSDAVRGQLKVLYPATGWSRGQNPIDRNAMKTRKKEILMEVYDANIFKYCAHY